MNPKIIFLPLLALFLFFRATPAYALKYYYTCPSHSDNPRYVQTALGCIDTSLKDGNFAGSLLDIILGLSGGIALLLILFGIFVITTSGGIPDKLNKGKQIVTAAVEGLVFILLSFVLLHFIGVQLLGIPGL